MDRETDRAAGPQRLLLQYESIPEQAADYPAANYLCFNRTLHLVEFLSRPGFVYRFDVDEGPAGHYRITAYEQHSPGQPEASAVDTRSKQLKAEPVCRFYEPLWDCGP